MLDSNELTALIPGQPLRLRTNKEVSALASHLLVSMVPERLWNDTVCQVGQRLLEPLNPGLIARPGTRCHLRRQLGQHVGALRSGRPLSTDD